MDCYLLKPDDANAKSSIVLKCVMEGLQLNIESCNVS